MSKQHPIPPISEAARIGLKLDNLLGSARSAIERTQSYATLHAEELAGRFAAIDEAHGALAVVRQSEASLAELVRSAGTQWHDQLVGVRDASSLALGSEPFREVTEQARRSMDLARQASEYAERRSPLAQIADNLRELASGESLQRLLQDQMSRFQRAMSPIQDLGAAAFAFQHLQATLDHERAQFESVMARLSGPNALSMNHLSDLQDEIARHALHVPQLGQIVREAIGIAEQSNIGCWTPATVKDVIDAVRWDELIQAIQSGTDSPPKAQSTPDSGLTSLSVRQRLSSREMTFLVGVLSLIVTVIGTLFESGLIQRFDAQDRVDTSNANREKGSETWAYASIPTDLLSEPRAGASPIYRIPRGAWLRIVEPRKEWLLVEVETGDDARIRGWIRALASRDLEDEIWDRAIQVLCDNQCESKASIAEARSDLPMVVRDAGEDACVAYACALASLNADSTRKAYERAYRRFFDFCLSAGIALPNVSPHDLLAYAALVADQDSTATARQHVIALRKLFDYLNAAGVVGVNPAADVTLPRQSPRRTGTVDGKDVERLLLELAGTRHADARDRAIVALIAGLGLKVSQVTSLRLEAVKSLENGRLQLKPEPRSQWVDVPDVVKEPLEAYLTLRQTQSTADDPLFVSTRSDPRERNGKRALSRGEIYAMLKRRAEACGIPELSCERLRNALR
jgi:site-specific recombinase XerD